MDDTRTDKINESSDTIEKVKVIGDLKITTTSGGNPKHNTFWHKYIRGCWCIRSTTETVLCSPPITTDENYFQCGFWRKIRYEKVKNV